MRLPRGDGSFRGMINFHLPLPEALSLELRDVAAAEKRPATEVARDLLRSALAERRRALQRVDIKAWAERNAGSELDLDVGLEAAGVEALQAPGRRRVAPRTRKKR